MIYCNLLTLTILLCKRRLARSESCWLSPSFKAASGSNLSSSTNHTITRSDTAKRTTLAQNTQHHGKNNQRRLFIRCEILKF